MAAKDSALTAPWGISHVHQIVHASTFPFPHRQNWLSRHVMAFVDIHAAYKTRAK